MVIIFRDVLEEFAEKKVKQKTLLKMQQEQELLCKILKFRFWVPVQILQLQGILYVL